MKKTPILVAILLILISITIQSNAKETLQTHSIAEIVVDNEGDGDYQTISAAIQQANNGDIIKIYSGTFKENIIVDKKIILLGCSTEYKTGFDTGKPILDGQQKGDVITLNSDACTLLNLAIVNGVIDTPAANGISIPGTSDHVIKNNTIQNNFIGIDLGSDTSFFSPELFKKYPEHCIIANNTINYNIFGIHLSYPKNHEIINNTLTDTGFSMIGPADLIKTNRFENNTVNQKPI